jgi:hypothetical protein
MKKEIMQCLEKAVNSNIREVSAYILCRGFFPFENKCAIK